MCPQTRFDGECIHIALAFDQHYLHPCYSLICSLVENHERGQLDIHAIADGISEQDKQKISSYIEYSGNRISYYSVHDVLVKRFVLPQQWTVVAYYRLFFAMLITRPIRRLLYLDCDTLVVNSLWSLYNTTLDGCPVGAVYDNYVKVQPRIGIEEEGEYFNSGMLLIDVPKWKEQRISERAFAYLLSHPENILYVDQCALNAVLRHNWRKLDSRFNLMYSCLSQDLGKKDYRRFLTRSVIIHFTLQRPWQMLCRNRFRKLYFHYLKRSGMVTRRAPAYADFKIKKIPAWLEIRILEFYFDLPWLQKIWRFIHVPER